MTRLPLWALVPDPHGLGGLLGPGAYSGGDPNAPCDNGGTTFYNPIADEHHPDATTSEHSRWPPRRPPRQHQRPRRKRPRRYRPNSRRPMHSPSAARPATTLAITVALVPTDHCGVQPVPMEALGRRGWRLPRRPAGGPHLGEPGEVTFESERKCRVETGRWYGAFTGTYVEAPGDLDIDHLVPLKNAHDSGGRAWSADRKQEYANYLADPDHLIAVTKGANRSKGAKGPEEWQPPAEGYWCQYATDWTEVKMEWGLTMTQRETEAVIEMLDTCEEPVEVTTEGAAGTAGMDTSGQAAAGEATATPTLVPEPDPEENTPVYGSCEEAVEAGETRVQGSAGEGRGFPKEMVPSARDGDGDSVVCER